MLEVEPWPVVVSGEQPDPLWSHYLAIDILARTADGLLVLTQRSGRVAVAGGAWILSVGETAEAGACAPEALDMVGHALRRKLGVVRLPRVPGWCLAVDEGDGAWSLSALADLAGTWPAIRAARWCRSVGTRQAGDPATGKARGGVAGSAVGTTGPGRGLVG